MNQDMFRNPPPEYRIHPFWFWNGDMENQQISVQISEMAEKGVGGFFLCARQGMKIPYLSDVWFEKVKFAIQTAEQYGLHVWIYDEYPYPSGIAGGEVILEHPDAKHRLLEHKKYEVSGGAYISVDLPWGKVISAVATPTDVRSGDRLWHQSIDIYSAIGNHQAEPVFQKTGLTNYNQKRFFTYQTVKHLYWLAPEGKWEIDIFIEREIDDFKYYGTFVDPGHAAAMKTFIQLTHERYKKEVGVYFGNTVKGIFTDEIGYLGHFPWSSRLRDKFKDLHGYDLDTSLQALVNNQYPNAGRTRYNYFQALHLLLRESYHKQVHDWCEENGLLFIAEVPSMRMTTQLHSHIVGSDSAHDKLGKSLEWSINRYYRNFRSNPKAASSLAVQLGRERALAECFHSIGWSMTLQDAKWMIDRMAAMGINFYNFHAFFYTLDSLTKHDAPPSQFLQNPYWKYFRTLGDYVGRISYVMSQGTPLHSIALLDSTTSMWTHLGNPLHGFEYIGDDPVEAQRLERLKTGWTRLGTELLLHQFGYDHLDSELLKDAEVSNGRIEIGKATYTTLIIPPISNLEFSTWVKVKEFLNQGGTVIAVGLLPYETIQEVSPDVEEVLQVFGVPDSLKSAYWDASFNGALSKLEEWYKGEDNAYFVPQRTIDSDATDASGVVISLLRQLHLESFSIEHEQAKRSFLLESRCLNDSYLVFVTNQEDREWDILLQINLEVLMSERDRNLDVSFWNLDLETGEYRLLEVVNSGSRCVLPLHFGPYESRLIQLGCELDSEYHNENRQQQEIYNLEISTHQGWEMAAKDPNVLRFDSFELSLNPAEQIGELCRVQVKTFIDQCTDIQEQYKLPIEFTQTFGTPIKMHISYPIHCTYKTKFYVSKLPSLCELFMDCGAISGDYEIYLNGIKLTSQNFQPKFFYDQANVACAVTDVLVEGENLLEIDVCVEHDWDGVVDAIYIAGDFGIEFDEMKMPVLTTPVRNGILRSGPYASYPFYAGTMSFTTAFRVEQAVESAQFRLAFVDWDPNFHDCAQVIVNGVALDVRPWAPYQWMGDTRILKQGVNQLELQVTNTLVGTLEGKYFDYQGHQLRDVLE